MKICSNCGKENADNARFCTGCAQAFDVNAPQQPVQQPAYQQPIYQQPSVPGKGLGVTSMALGIIALVFVCVPLIAFLCGIVGLILGGVSLSKAKAAGLKNGFAVAGITCSCIAIGLLLLSPVLSIALGRYAMPNLYDILDAIMPD